MELKDNCGICLVNMTRGEIRRLIPCGHLFHSKCFATLNTRCPLCRSEIDDAARVERKTYKKVFNSRILDAADKGNDWSELAASLNVSYKTAHRWVTDTNKITLKRGGCKPRSLTEDEIETILTWIEVKPDITLREISSKIFGEFEKRV